MLAALLHKYVPHLCFFQDLQILQTGVPVYNHCSLWEVILTKEPYATDYKNVLHLVNIILILPISAAQCERGFSAQNRILCSLHVSTLEDLIQIGSEGPSLWSIWSQALCETLVWIQEEEASLHKMAKWHWLRMLPVNPLIWNCK